MRGLRLALSLVLAFVLMMPAIATAKDTDAAGKVTAVQGKSEVKKSGGAKKFNAFKGMAIGKGDTVLTGKDGKLTMSLGTDKEAVIGANTTLTVSELVKSASAMGGKTSISLSKGSVLIKIKQKLDGDSRFQIETPTAIMGVMGTEFAVSVEEDETYVGVFEGKVETRSGEDRSQTDYVLPNGQLKVNAEGEATPEELNAVELPLVALEYYAELLQADGNADPALLKRVVELLQKKQSTAGEQAAQATPRPTTIIYGDEGAGQSGPAATPAPTPEPTPSPSQSPNPPQPGAPEFDSDAFYGDIYDYVINDTTIRIPFTRELAFADGVEEDAEENGWESYVRVEWEEWSNNCGCTIQVLAVISDVDIDGNELVVTLDNVNSMHYGSSIWLAVSESTITNLNYPEDVQTSNQFIFDPCMPLGEPGFNQTEGYEFEFPPLCGELPVEWQPHAFKFEIEVTPSYLNIDKSTLDPEGYTEIFVPTLLGYADSPEDLYVSLYQSEWNVLAERYVWIEQSGGGWKLQISNEALADLEVEWYELRIWLSESEKVEIWVEVEENVQEEPSYPPV